MRVGSATRRRYRRRWLLEKIPLCSGGRPFRTVYAWLKNVKFSLFRATLSVSTSIVKYRDINNSHGYDDILKSLCTYYNLKYYISMIIRYIIMGRFALCRIGIRIVSLECLEHSHQSLAVTYRIGTQQFWHCKTNNIFIYYIITYWPISCAQSVCSPADCWSVGHLNKAIKIL